MTLEPLPELVWSEVVGRLAGDVRLGARLLAGEMPPEVEEVVEAAGAHLFPDRYRELETACSCPDWSNPCKHVAAVHYLLAEELDRDPFLLFRLRGRERERIIEELVEAGGRMGEESAAAAGVGSASGAPPAAPGGDREAWDAAREVAWPADPDLFWGHAATAHDGDEAVAPDASDRSDAPGATSDDPDERRLAWATSSHAALVRRLGPLPFWRGERPFLDEMTQIYRKASAQARALLAPREDE
jgi:uncharacterized Zn finger protein